MIGYVNGMSGAVAVYGEYSLAYLQAAVKQANASGGVAGHQVQVKVLDSAAVGLNAVSAMQQMITKNKPSVIYGMTLSQDCASAAPVAKKYAVPLICATIPENVAQPVQKYAFGSLALESSLAQPSLAFAAKTLKLPSGSRYATIVASGSGDLEYAKAVDAAAAAAGYRKVAGQVVQLGAPSAATQISNVVAAKPDVVFSEVVGSHIAPLVKGLRDAGNPAPVLAVFPAIGYDGLLKLADPGFYEVAQANVVTDQSAAASSGVAQVQKILTAGGLSGPVEQNQQLGAQAILLALGILQAFRACAADCSPAKMVTALESVRLDLDGFAKGYGWSASNHMPISNVDIISYDPAMKAPKTDAADMSVGSAG